MILDSKILDREKKDEPFVTPFDFWLWAATELALKADRVRARVPFEFNVSGRIYEVRYAFCVFSFLKSELVAWISVRLTAFKVGFLETVKFPIQQARRARTRTTQRIRSEPELLIVKPLPDPEQVAVAFKLIVVQMPCPKPDEPGPVKTHH